MKTNRNSARDLARSKNPRQRLRRVFTPTLKHLNPEDPTKLEVKKLSQWEMDAIRTMEEFKCCGRCGEIKETKSSFHRDNREPDGWYWKCKECRRKNYGALLRT